MQANGKIMFNFRHMVTANLLRFAPDLIKPVVLGNVAIRSSFFFFVAKY